ncbi:hypothetical protein EHQ43_03210 [Leptospira bouyouniensis]|uniref:Uncharacterized protein n=1 Tax=Leptospira bouyouniensis TaxID=2484911 RepID=A0A7I0HV69_9LEPT|nr:hypothetical protein EHQ10_09440 [Leptospira bouyouniensis]TGL08068.1 hypothetical protein EHQ43_03210 [Leptospira bouyouniensis]TGM87511.1 hypothetical protein EHQ99_03195 [Leptospira bouyouniensis]
MRSTEVQEKKSYPFPNSVLQQKLESFTNTMLQSLQTQTNEETTWAVISMTGEVLAHGSNHPQVDRFSDSLFTF